MNRVILFANLLILFAANTGFGQEITPPPIPADTLQEKLSSYKHLGILKQPGGGQLDDRVIYLFTEKQFKSNLNAKQKYKKDYVEKYDFISRRITEAKKRNADYKEIKDLVSKRKQIRKPNLNVLLISIDLYNIKHVGKDYVELTEPDDESSITIIPMRKIARIRISKTNFNKRK